MRAFAVQAFGDRPALLDLPRPLAGSGYGVRVRCAGVNPVDQKLVGRLTAESVFPFVLGVDFAGVLEELPAGETELRAGDRVFGMARTHGSYAEYTAVRSGTPGLPVPIARIPDEVTDEQAAALPVAALAALGSLDWLGIGAGQRLVVTGAAGAVGGYAVQIARHRGAHVIATVRGGADEARRLGADEIYETGAGDVIAAIRAAYPNGVDAVLDNVSGQDSIHRDAELLGPGGKLVSTVHAADEDWFAGRQITAHNISGPTNPLASPAGLAELARLAGSGVITTRVKVVGELADAAQVLDQLRTGGLHGKALLRMS